MKIISTPIFSAIESIIIQAGKSFAKFFLFVLMLTGRAVAQLPNGGGGVMIEKTPCMSETQRQDIVSTLKENMIQLERKGVKFTTPSITAAVPVGAFIWPVKQAIVGAADPGFWGISNYVDEDTSSAILDYNCGTTSYNGHRGTDIFTWPFGWTSLDNSQIQIIASAGGTIIGKSDGFQDKSCVNCTACDWNAVYVRNLDGSVCWYGHMKTGTTTSKPVGATVSQGEYLGIVGSSGNSTGPHLHFEVWSSTAYNQLLDPWQGACNKFANQSLFTSQLAYKAPAVNKIATHNAVPEFSQCYGGENPHFSNQFLPGSLAYFAVYLKDQQPTTSAVFTILRPDNTIYSQFLHNLTSYYQASYWYWTFTLPAAAPSGTWTFRYQYQGVTASHNFVVGTVLPLTLTNFKITNQPGSAKLTWETYNELNVADFWIERSVNGVDFNRIGQVASSGNSGSYHYNDFAVSNGAYFYRLKMNDRDGKFTYSSVLRLQRTSPLSNYRLAGNPVVNTLSLLSAKDGEAVLQIVDFLGRTHLTRRAVLNANLPTDIPVSTLPRGSYYLVVQCGAEQHRMQFLKQ